jgi:ribosome-binding factor A
MSSQRAERVARQVLQEVSAIVEHDLKDPRIGMVTFTMVRMGPDLRTAHVYFSCLDGEAARRSCEEGLAHAKSYLRREVGRRLRLRYAPELRFEFDDSLDRAERITRLLDADRRAHESDRGGSTDERPPAKDVGVRSGEGDDGEGDER